MHATEEERCAFQELAEGPVIAADSICQTVRDATDCGRCAGAQRPRPPVAARSVHAWRFEARQPSAISRRPATRAPQDVNRAFQMALERSRGATYAWWLARCLARAPPAADRGGD